MSPAGAKSDAIAAAKRSGAKMSAGAPARIFIGHQGAFSAVISVPESN